MSDSKIAALLQEVSNCLEKSAPGASATNDGLIALLSKSLSEREILEVQPQVPAHNELLEQAISKIDERQLEGLKSALMGARDHLHWKVDDGGYYESDADVGQGYKRGNMHTLLVGPKDAVIFSSEILIGVFLLAPWTLYRDHKHSAPEIYVPLTGPSGWRFELENWHDHRAGSMIFNASEVVHATRVYETPFLAIFAWTGDIASSCTVVSCDDWERIEEQLFQQKNSQAEKQSNS